MSFHGLRIWAARIAASNIKIRTIPVVIPTYCVESSCTTEGSSEGLVVSVTAEGASEVSGVGVEDSCESVGVGAGGSVVGSVVGSVGRSVGLGSVVV